MTPPVPSTGDHAQGRPHTCTTCVVTRVSHLGGTLALGQCSELSALKEVSNLILNIFDEQRVGVQGVAVQAERMCGDQVPAIPAQLAHRV